MSDLSQARDILRTVLLYRRKGDAAAQRGKDDTARQAWKTALSASSEAFEALSIPATADPAEVEASGAALAADAAELLGVRGGILRRLGQTSDALESYRNGAVWEASHNLSQTYNRMNAIKLALIVGDKTLAQLHDELIALRSVLEQRLSTDERAADDAWLWADLGDVRLLLGDDDGTLSAYRDFATRARTDSSASSLTVLNELVQALHAHEEPNATRVAAGVDRIETMIRAR